MSIPSLSTTLQKTLKETLENLPIPTEDADVAILLAMKQISTRIQLGEPNLYEPLHRGDLLALTLADME